MKARTRSRFRRKWNVGLRVRFMALVSHLVVFAVVSVSAIGIVLVIGAAKGRVTDTHRETLDLAAFVVDDFFNHHFESMAFLARVISSPELSSQSRWLQLEGLLADHEEILEASALDAGGQEVIRVSRIEIFSQVNLTNRSADEFFQKSMGGERYMAQPVDSPRGFSTVALSVPIKASPRSNLGVVFADLRLSSLSDWVGQVRLGDTGRLYLVDQAGRVIAHPDASVALRHENVRDRWPVAQALQGASVLAVSSPDSRYLNEAGKQVLASARSLAGSHLVLVLEQEEDEAMAPLRQALWTSIPLSLFALMVSLGLGFWFTGRLVSPIRVLREASEGLERGNLASRAKVTTGDELEQLAGAFNRMASTISDRTERLESAVSDRTERLKASLDRMAGLMDVLPVGFVVSSPEGRMLEANAAALKMFGYDSRYEFLGLPAHTHYVDISNRAFIVGEMEIGLVKESELRLRRKDGTVFWASVSGVAQTVPSGGRQLIVALEDITERRRADEAIRLLNEELEQRVADRTLRLESINHELKREIGERERAEEALARYSSELERSNAELGQFAYIASHDLQEPLRMVTSYLQLLAQRYQGQFDSSADEFIAYAVDGAARMQTLINDLLAYSRVGTRGRPFEPTETQSVLEQALSNLRLAVQESGALITHDPMPPLLGDETQLVQLFQNLISNALKFRRGIPPTVHVGVVERDGDWLFSVRDNGIGIDPQYAERIFVIFQRLHRGRDYRGTGMGLAICRKILERHGGRIWVESQLGEGSTFYFTMPVMDGGRVPTAAGTEA